MIFLKKKQKPSNWSKAAETTYVPGPVFPLPTGGWSSKGRVCENVSPQAAEDLPSLKWFKQYQAYYLTQRELQTEGSSRFA